ncbi:hypothetical protein TNIN_334201 [Trichonephila inaurata madagascariensis]|uniref:Uncharacterized protein n=1 Tax=Trichonephila inaurata madagascariensis TaxID=2747483 RepID=A0A8X6IB09_9ARAC|nr:hypothetical protein TNIN_334201 [Trichonephila inaurata madagascariensis]
MGTLKSELEFEHILEDVGDFGKYQKRLIIFFLIPSAALLPWFTMNILFLVFTPDHWCNVPEVAASNLSIEIQRNIIAPLDKSSCYRYDLNYTDFLKTGSFHVKNDTPLVECDNGWQYDTTHFQETAASKNRPEAGVFHRNSSHSNDRHFIHPDDRLHSLPRLENHQRQSYAIRLPTPFHHP